MARIREGGRMTPPDWLPEMVSVDGGWDEVCARLYAIFQQKIVKGHLSFENRPLWWDRRVLEENYEEGFWHLISKDDDETKERLFDPRRAERLPWCNPVISNNSDPVVTVWDHKEGRKKIRTYLWLESFDYLIILEKQKRGGRKIAFLITAYHVSGDSTKRGLRAKYQKRLP
jgi:hypothetical protein